MLTNEMIKEIQTGFNSSTDLFIGRGNTGMKKENKDLFISHLNELGYKNIEVEEFDNGYCRITNLNY